MSLVDVAQQSYTGKEKEETRFVWQARVGIESDQENVVGGA